jgi:AcrR family transcriptional regulator
MTAAATRRDRLRVQTTSEIKQHAWRILADTGAADLSLRAVARAMGMAPSAIYRYFPSRNDLLTELIVDGFDSLTEAVSAAYDEWRAQDATPGAADAFLHVAKAQRRWALAHPTEYRFIFSTSIPDYVGNEQTTAASVRASSVLLSIMVDKVNAGAVDLERIDAVLTDELRSQLMAWSRAGGCDLPAPALAAAMWCYSALHGAVGLEVNGHLPPSLQGSEALFESTIRNVMRRITPE